MQLFNTMKIRDKIIAGFLITIIADIIVVVLGANGLKIVADYSNSMYSDRLLPIEQIAQAQSLMFTIRGDYYKIAAVKAEQAKYLGEMNDNIGSIDAVMNSFKATKLLDTEKDALVAYDKAFTEFSSALNEFEGKVNAGDDAGAMSLISGDGRVVAAREGLGNALAVLMSLNDKEAERLRNEGRTTEETRSIIMYVIGALGAILGVVFGLLISRYLTNSMKVLVTSSRSMAEGDLLRDMDEKTKNNLTGRKDEVGDVGKGLKDLIVYLQGMGETANRIADNDLSMEIQPKSEKDELGNSFKRMVHGLRDSISQVADNANSVGSASKQLADAASQAGQVTGQIAATIQEVAKGTSMQSENISKTASSIEQMSRAIDGVAHGAQEQASAVGRASDITALINTSIQQVSANAQSVTTGSTTAAEASRNGSKVVDETIKGMEIIKEKVGLSAVKVQEMGSRSEQIGAIVETINEIASQTNMLALNAAIEAARAGEHGKGFAVVADEVKKLAERSSNATKEIGEIIRGIQQTVADAVTAMDEGAKEVERGSSKANEAGSALESILKASEEVNKEAVQAAEASKEMGKNADELVASMDTVSAVVEQNTASTEEMAAGSTDVTQAIENIASISEENSAAIEEVSASAEEMTAQVEEVSASAQSLADMADALQKVVQRFKLN